MTHEALELHDSRLSAVRSEAGQVILSLAPAYIHRSLGVPGRDEGTGWLANVTLTLTGAVLPSITSDLPVQISDGAVVIGETTIDNCVTLPFKQVGAISLRLVFETGETLVVQGSSLDARVQGGYEFVENFGAV
jgi:hypothetical protein